jgi:hypothetical protein
MNKYLVPVCKIQSSKVYNLIIIAKSFEDCEEKVMEKFPNIEGDDYESFLVNADKQDILIGSIKDVEEL